MYMCVCVCVCVHAYAHVILIVTLSRTDGLLSLQELLYHSGESQSVFPSKLLDEVIKTIVSDRTLIKIFISWVSME